MNKIKCTAYLGRRAFPNFRASNPWIDEFYVVQKYRTTDFKAPKFWKGLSGCWHLPLIFLLSKLNRLHLFPLSLQYCSHVSVCLSVCTCKAFSNNTQDNKTAGPIWCLNYLAKRNINSEPQIAPIYQFDEAPKTLIRGFWGVKIMKRSVG